MHRGRRIRYFITDNWAPLLIVLAILLLLVALVTDWISYLLAAVAAALD